MSATLGPLGQLDENIFTSPPSLRRHSTSSMATTISCASNPNSPAPRTPKCENMSSPTHFRKGTFSEDDFLHRFDCDDRKSHHGTSIAPNLLSINEYHSQEEDLLQPDQLEQIDQVLLHQPQPQFTQHSIVRYTDSHNPGFINCSDLYTSWEPPSPRHAAMDALQCVTEGYEDGFEMSDEDSQLSSPTTSPVLSCPPSKPRRRTLTSPSPPRKQGRHARVSRRVESEFPLVVSSADKPHVCPLDTCRKRFKRPEHLRRHERTHTSDKPYGCDAEGCTTFFSRTDNLRAHKRTHMKVGGRNHYVPGLQI